MIFHPNTSIVEICAEGDFILTCKTDTGTLVWRVGVYTKTTKTFSNTLLNQPTSLGDHITVYATNVSSSVITSVANITGAPLALNGTVIQCRDNGGDSKEKVLIVSGKSLFFQFVNVTHFLDRISAPRNLSFTALNFTTASIEWALPSCLGHLVEVYYIQIFNITLNLTSPATSVNVTGLSRGVEHNVTVYGKNLTCTSYEGEKATLLMTLDGMHAYYCNNTVITVLAL